ncbi:MAG: hypothetical protein ACTHLH_08350 [Solirubrobacterales bacterium]
MSNQEKQWSLLPFEKPAPPVPGTYEERTIYMHYPGIPTLAEDDAKQAELLHHVLQEHPILLERGDLVRELSGNPELFGDRDAVDRALDRLVRVGLLDQRCDRVWPTRAALYFWDVASHFIGM